MAQLALERLRVDVIDELGSCHKAAPEPRRPLHLSDAGGDDEVGLRDHLLERLAAAQFGRGRELLFNQRSEQLLGTLPGRGRVGKYFPCE